MLGIGLPIKIRARKGCDRCGLKHDRKLSSCPHCSELSDMELIEFKSKHQDQLKSNSELGIQFLAITFLIAIVLLAFAM